MNLLHLARSDLAGGAAQATYQIHTLLREAGHRSILAVRNKTSSDPDVVTVGARSLLSCTWAEGAERAKSRLAGGYKVTSTPLHYFNLNMAPIPDLEAALQAMPRPDVLFIHWITTLLTAADIRRLHERVNCPIVWILLDMEPMTGGCHYPGACTRYQSACTECPQLTPGSPLDWARRTWTEKQRQLAGLPITFLAPTRWLEDKLAASSLFRRSRVENIPLPMNAHMRPVGKSSAREVLGIPPGKKIILVGSQDLEEPRKGMDRLIEAARILESRGLNRDVLFRLIGSNGRTLAKRLPFPSSDAGYIRNDLELALSYQAADIFASPSLEDAGPMMISQAMLCGTPVVAFDTGIARELITTGYNGYLARTGDAADFAVGLERLLADDGSAGRRAAETASRHHDPLRITALHEALMHDLTGTRESKDNTHASPCAIPHLPGAGEKQ